MNKPYSKNSAIIGRGNFRLPITEPFKKISFLVSENYPSPKIAKTEFFISEK